MVKAPPCHFEEDPSREEKQGVAPRMDEHEELRERSVVHDDVREPFAKEFRHQAGVP